MENTQVATTTGLETQLKTHLVEKTWTKLCDTQLVNASERDGLAEITKEDLAVIIENSFSETKLFFIEKIGVYLKEKIAHFFSVKAV